MGNRYDLISLKMCPRFSKIKTTFISKRKAKVQLSIQYVIQNVAHFKKENGAIEPGHPDTYPHASILLSSSEDVHIVDGVGVK